MRHLALGLALALLATCARPAARPPAEQVKALRFPHALGAHAAIGCPTCHDPKDVLAGRPARPGKADHAPCDSGNCHAPLFLAAPGAFCQLCHEEVEPWRTGGTTPVDFPPRASERSAPSTFSHTLHLDKARLDAAVGFHVACNDCHARAEGGDFSPPDHTACVRCHGPEKSIVPHLADCTSCHRDPAAFARRDRRLILGDLRFQHAPHEADRQGQGIACVSCHEGIAGQARAEQRATPTTRSCVECHDDAKRTPETRNMQTCATCHESMPGQSFALVAPRSHLPPRDRPNSHTLAFRKDHGDDARRGPGSCATCHTGLSGKADGCDECHQVMRPADHLPLWTELSHGPDASADARRCARCHTGDFCTTCHARPPRSHRVAGGFGGFPGDPAPPHAGPARLNLRACLTCHNDMVADCAGSGCHTGLTP